MSKAILGSFADPRTLQLLDEIRALRARVAALEEALEQAEEAAAQSPAIVVALDESDTRSLDPAGSATA